MNLIAFSESSIAIKIHVLLAVLALCCGIYALWSRKGSTSLHFASLHKFAGHIFVGSMLGVALTSFFIHEIRLAGPFSPIHLISIYVLFALYYGVRAIRRGDVRTHQSIMKWLFFAGLIVPGIFTFLPERLMFDIFIAPQLSDGAMLQEINPIFAAFGGLIATTLVLIVMRWMQRHNNQG